ncbi:PP_RS20740 family protein [Paraburkholderia caribensis]|uniref:PP_RS20740 family protein n=1 Tax=Paraburkholderia caribensis TaxID=75105 RepID=UPI001CB6029F|nr:hypothetical protein [Paraburkholderia caribensis]CAG9262091.1 conserved hypothetical protein [Paraburkholderia caribensis]
MNDTNANFGESDESFEEGIAPVSTAHVSFEIRTKFLPWHKPRKQWVRANQWADSIGRLVDNLSLKQAGRSLRYLSLPGPDLLDVRSIQPICEAKGVALQFLGLNSGDDDDAEVGLEAALLSRVRSLPFIDPASEVVKDRFEQLAVNKSVAYSRVITAQRSFDVVNLDLCGSFAEGPSGVKGGNIVNALFALLHHQANHRQDDWLFFITTRSNQDMVDEQTMVKLVDAVNRIMAERPELKSAIAGSGIVAAEELTDGAIDISKLSPQSFSNSFALGLSHWVIHSLLKAERAWKADMLPHFEYHVLLKDKACDMLSLGFYCKRIPVPRSDEIGLARVDDNIPAPLLDEINLRLKLRVPDRISKRTDLDCKLHLDPQLYDECLQQSAKLLASSNYDEHKYREWAEEQRAEIVAYMTNVGIV